MVAVEGMLMAAEAESDEAGRREATAAATEAGSISPGHPQCVFLVASGTSPTLISPTPPRWFAHRIP